MIEQAMREFWAVPGWGELYEYEFLSDAQKNNMPTEEIIRVVEYSALEQAQARIAELENKLSINWEKWNANENDDIINSQEERILELKAGWLKEQEDRRELMSRYIHDINRKNERIATLETALEKAKEFILSVGYAKGAEEIDEAFRSKGEE